MDESAELSVGSRLKLFREFLKLTQVQFASAIGGTAIAIQGNESGRSMPNGKSLIGLYKLGMDINWLLTGEGQMLLTKQPPNSSGGDLRKFADAMEIIDLYVQRTGKVLSPEKKRKAVEALYKLSEGKAEIDPSVTEMIMQLAA